MRRLARSLEAGSVRFRPITNLTFQGDSLPSNGEPQALARDQRLEPSVALDRLQKARITVEVALDEKAEASLGA